MPHLSRVFALFLVLLISAASARAQTVLDTFGPGNGVGAGASLVTGFNIVAVRFVAPAGQPTSIERVDLSIGVTGVVSSASVGIWAESNGLPTGTVIATQAIASPLFPAPSLISVPFTSPVQLTAGAAYWVGVITNTSGINGISWSSGTSPATVAVGFGSTFSPSAQQAPAVRVVLGPVPCAPTTGVDTLGSANQFTPTGALGIGSGVTAAWRLTVPAGPARPLTSVELPLGVFGTVSDASIVVWNANAANTLPTGSPVLVQPIPGPLAVSPVVVNVPVSSQTALAPGNYFIGVRATAAGANFLVWAAAPTGSALVPTSTDGGLTWSTANNPNAPAIRATLGCPAQQCRFGPIFDLFGPSNSFAPTGPTVGPTVSAVKFTVPADGVHRLAWLVDVALQTSQANMNVSLNIWPDIAGLPSSNPIIASAIVIPQTTPQVVQWILNSPVPLAPGTSYWVGLTVNGPGSLTFFQGGIPVFVDAATRSPGGAWTLDASSSNTLAVRVIAECADFGACCNSRGGGCALLGRADCLATGGTFNPGFPCTGFNCASVLVGACCRGSTCLLTTVSACPPGTFLGPGTSCAPLRAGGANVCCGADFNNSGTLNVQDIFSFLSAWFAGCP